MGLHNLSLHVFAFLLWLFLHYQGLQKLSKKQQKLSVKSCLQRLCRKQLPGLSSLFPGTFNCLAEAVQTHCRSCYYVCRLCQLTQFGIFSSCDVHFTVLGFDVNSFHLVSSLMSLACSWTHVDSLDSVCNSFYSCHGFAVQLVDSFTALILGWSCNVLCLSWTLL